jgi:NAD(P)H-dependent flavin oxidoreductase YrpB (nitropropane dioxygenase family)
MNHVVQAVAEETFSLGLSFKPKLVSMALADPGDYVKRVHDAGAESKTLLPTAGQSAGGITKVLPAAEIVRLLVEEAEATLRDAARLA